MLKKSRQELDEYLEKIWKLRCPDKYFDKKSFIDYDDDSLRLLISELQYVVNSDLEYQKVLAQFRNRFKGRQKGRALKSF